MYCPLCGTPLKPLKRKAKIYEYLNEGKKLLKGSLYICPNCRAIFLKISRKRRLLMIAQPIFI